MTAGEIFSVHFYQLLAMAILLVGSSFFSGSETALFSLTRSEIFRLSSGGGGKLVSALLKKPERLLNTLLLSNLLINTAFEAMAATIAFDFHRQGFGVWVTSAAVFLPLLVLILFGEVCPKMLAGVVGQRWAITAAPLVAFFQKALAIPVWILEGVIVKPLLKISCPRPAQRGEITPTEMAELLNLSQTRGAIDPDSSMLLQAIMDLTTIRCREVMIPRVDMVSFDISDTRENLMELFRKTRFRRIVVRDGDMDHLLGVIHCRKFICNPSASVNDLVENIPFVPEHAMLEKVLIQLRGSGCHLAFVVDEFGGTCGLITLKDIVEEIVGDIPEPGQEHSPPAVGFVSEREYLVDGTLAIHEWVEAFNMDAVSRRFSTIGGFVTSLLGRIPLAGDTATYRNLTFTVQSVNGKRIGKIKIELAEGRE